MKDTDFVDNAGDTSDPTQVKGSDRLFTRETEEQQDAKSNELDQGRVDKLSGYDYESDCGMFRWIF